MLNTFKATITWLKISQLAHLTVNLVGFFRALGVGISNVVHTCYILPIVGFSQSLTFPL